MKIEWLGHSSFRLTESTGISIITDPFESRKVGIPFPNLSADIVTVSHNHYDHNATGEVQNVKTIISETGAHELDGVQVYGFMSYHDNKKGKLRGKNIVYKFRMDGVDICHLGDIGEPLSPLLAELIGSLHILLIPIGGNYTIDAKEAKEYVDFLMPDVVIPMHYKVDGQTSDIDDLDEFLSLFDREDIEFAEDNAIEFDRAQFDGNKTRVIVCKKLN